MAANISHENDKQLEIENWKNQEKMSLKVLNPDDPLMRRFQEALKTHLLRINQRLTSEILELEASNKEAMKKREEKGMEMYEAQREISRQQTSIDKYCTSLEHFKKSHEENEHRLKEKKNFRNKIRQDADQENHRVDELSREIENLASQCKNFEKFENEIKNHINVAKRMSEKDASVQRELLRQKQEEDYILLNLSQQVWKLEREILDMKKQQNLKYDDKMIIAETIAEADADLGGLQRERKGLLTAWNRVVASILQRDKITEELSTERT